MAHVVLFMPIKNDSLPEAYPQDGLLTLSVKIMFRNSKKGLGVFGKPLLELWPIRFLLWNPKGV